MKRGLIKKGITNHLKNLLHLGLGIFFLLEATAAAINPWFPDLQNESDQIRVEFKSIKKTRRSDASAHLVLRQKNKQAIVQFEGSGLLKGEYLVLVVKDCDSIKEKIAFKESEIHNVGKLLLPISTDYGEISSEASVLSKTFGWNEGPGPLESQFLLVIKTKGHWFFLACEKP